ncbi:MAG: hypothetical protein ACJAZO_005112, partial [Myxococcota bacterium]
AVSALDTDPMGLREVSKAPVTQAPAPRALLSTSFSNTTK